MFIEFTIIIHTSNNSKVTCEKHKNIQSFHFSRLKSREKQQLGRGSQAKSKGILLFLQKREEPGVRVGPYREHHKTEPVEYFQLLYTNKLNFSYRKPLSNLTMTRGPQISSSRCLNYFSTN